MTSLPGIHKLFQLPQGTKKGSIEDSAKHTQMMKEEKEFITKGLKKALLVKSTSKERGFFKSEEINQTVAWYQDALVS